jgi:hypothetical protein
VAGSGSPGAVSSESAAEFGPSVGSTAGSVGSGRACANVGRDGCEVRLCRSVGSDPCVRVSRLSRFCSLLTCLDLSASSYRHAPRFTHTPHADAHPSTRRIAHFHRPGHRRRSH